MKISFHGACQEVTGSCTLIETTDTNFLIDCGMFQGSSDAKEKNKAEFEFKASSINFVFLTHAHIDHCGRLPKLYKSGFRGKIFSTKATRDLAEIILLDSIKIQKIENEKPEFTKEDIRGIINLFETIKYKEEVQVNNNLKVRVQDAGHILGSSIFEFWVTENEITKKIVVSGDLGNPPAPIIKDPTFIEDADVLITESTYGGNFHEEKEIGREKFKKTLLETILNKATVIIPVFALERSQEILYELNELIENKIIPQIPVYFDSPLAIRATKIYRQYKKLYDNEAKHLINSGDDIFDFPNLQITETRNESMGINSARAPKIILAGSGMCTGGRIPHHLKFNLDNPKNNLLIMSYQAVGTLGRELVDGAKNVIINDKMINVNCKITKINSYSAHADHNQLLNWIHKINGLKKVFVIHGEDLQNKKLAEGINSNIEKIIPKYKDKFEI